MTEKIKDLYDATTDDPKHGESLRDRLIACRYLIQNKKSSDASSASEEKIRKDDPGSDHPVSSDMTEEVTSLITFWNDLYGNIMYRVAIPAREDKLFKLVCDRSGDYGYTAIRQAIIRIGSSRYLLGRLDQPPVSIYWFLNSKNLRNVLNGNYDDYSAAERREGITRDLAARHIRHVAGDSRHIENTDNSTELALAASPAYSSAAFPSKKNRGLERNTDLDAWLIDQIIHNHPLSS